VIRAHRTQRGLRHKQGLPFPHTRTLRQVTLHAQVGYIAPTTLRVRHASHTVGVAVTLATVVRLQEFKREWMVLGQRVTS